MGYGIKILSGIDSIQIDSDLSMTGLRVKSFGTSSTLTGFSGLGADELIAINYQTANNTSTPISIDRGYPNYTATWEFVNNQGTSVAVDWVVLEPYNTLTASTSGYGVQILDINSNLVFDTGLTNNDGTSVTAVAGSGEFSGNYLADSGPLSDTLTDYIIANSFTYVQGQVFFGTVFANNFTIGQATKNGIYNSSYLTIPTEFGDITSYLPNSSDLYTLKLGDV